MAAKKQEKNRYHVNSKIKTCYHDQGKHIRGHEPLLNHFT